MTNCNSTERAKWHQRYQAESYTVKIKRCEKKAIQLQHTTTLLSSELSATLSTSLLRVTFSWQSEGVVQPDCRRLGRPARHRPPSYQRGRQRRERIRIAVHLMLRCSKTKCTNPSKCSYSQTKLTPMLGIYYLACLSPPREVVAH